MCPKKRRSKKIKKRRNIKRKPRLIRRKLVKKKYRGPERRKFVRLDYIVPIACKVCKKKTISKLLQGYTVNISEAGLLCNIQDRVKKNDIVWLAFDRNTLTICENLERRSFVYQNGIVAKVIRVAPRRDKSYDVGLQFITREEKNLTHIYPKVHFIKDITKVRSEDWQELEEEQEEEISPEEREEEVLEEEAEEKKERWEEKEIGEYEEDS